MKEEMSKATWQVFEDVVSRFHRILHSHFTNNTYGLTVSQVFILRYLTSCPNAKASDIAKVSGLSPGAITQVCDELVRMGFVERSRSSNDRRVVHVNITPMGREKFESVRKLRSDTARAILQELGQKDVEEFARIVNRIVEIVERNALEKR